MTLVVDETPLQAALGTAGRHRITVIDLGVRRRPAQPPPVLRWDDPTPVCPVPAGFVPPRPAVLRPSHTFDAFDAFGVRPSPMPRIKPVHADPRRRDLRLEAKAAEPPSWLRQNRKYLAAMLAAFVVLVLSGQLGSSGNTPTASHKTVAIPGSAQPFQAQPALAPGKKNPARPASPRVAPAKGTAMVVGVSALNVRKAPSTKGNQPVTSRPRGTKVTVLLVTRAVDSPDRKTRWAKTRSGWMWYGGLSQPGKASTSAGVKPAATRPSHSGKHHAARYRSYGNTHSKAYQATVRQYAKTRFARYGWSVGGQFGCLNRLWIRESGWRHTAYNRSGGATGIPQSLPGRKMASAGSDWRTNPETQINWGLSYIKSRYGTPCSAWGHSQSHNWY